MVSTSYAVQLPSRHNSLQKVHLKIKCFQVKARN